MWRLVLTVPLLCCSSEASVTCRDENDGEVDCFCKDTDDMLFACSSGVVMVDKTGTGVWLLHSTPQFPYDRDQNNFWPPTGAANAQIFICVTFYYNQFTFKGTHLKYIGVFPFEHDPLYFHQELRDVVNWVHPILDLLVQTLGCQALRAHSFCKPNKQKLGNWKASVDHSKSCVANDPRKHWTCNTYVNRAKTQYDRHGGALGIKNAAIKTALGFIDGVEDCKVQHSVDTSQCAPQPGANPDLSMG
ncbi:plancitoxin-1-like [Channa argus]|uniref:plancitoxin-1-like n=1 Tax=Channa argus TaxID=215402 RepID=UPI0035203972